MRIAVCDDMPSEVEKISAALSVYIKAHPELQKEDPEFDRWCDSVAAAQEKALQELLASQI